MANEIFEKDDFKPKRIIVGRSIKPPVKTNYVDHTKPKLKPAEKDKYRISAETDDDDDLVLNIYGDDEELEEDWQSFLSDDEIDLEEEDDKED